LRADSPNTKVSASPNGSTVEIAGSVAGAGVGETRRFAARATTARRTGLRAGAFVRVTGVDLASVETAFFAADLVDALFVTVTRRFSLCVADI
jgi:hypothetical protein